MSRPATSSPEPDAPSQRMPGHHVPKRGRAHYVVTAGIIAAVYAVVTITAMQLMLYLSWGPIQLRLSEALTILPLFTPAAIPGLTLGSVIANLSNVAVAGPLAWLDVIFGSAATLGGAMWTYRFRSRPKLALLGPILTNSLIVPAYLPLMLKGLGVYNIPFLPFSIESSYLAMYTFGVVTIFIGEALVVYGLGLPLKTALSKSSIFPGKEQ